MSAGLRPDARPYYARERLSGGRLHAGPSVRGVTTHTLRGGMALDETARERLGDVRELQPTSNSELAERWGMDSGKDVAAYLRDVLGEHTYRDDDSRIRAVDGTDDATSPEAEPRESTERSQNGAENGVSEHGASHEGNGSDGTDDPDENVQSGASPGDMTPEEIDEVIDGAKQAGYEEGYSDGVEEGGALSDEEIQQLWQDAYEEGYNDALQETEGTDDPLESEPLPCGHEQIDPVEFLRDHEVQVGCEVCGEWYEGTILG